MKKLFCLLLTLCLVCLVFSTVALAEGENPPENIISDAYVVMDAQTGQVLIEKNMNKKEYPASITKILTVGLALEKKQLTDTTTISEEAVFSIDRGSSHIALTHGEVVTLEQLANATILASANDAANGIAELVSGSLADFNTLMNQKLSDLGVKNTHFTNAHGLHDENHYTTAYDMGIITKYALTVPGFREIFGRDSYTMAPTNTQSEPRLMGTQHSMFVESSFTYEGATGGKLGWTPEANHTMVTIANRGDIELICVVMNSASKYDKYEDTAALLDYGFDNYQKLHFLPSEIDSKEIPLYTGETQTGTVTVSPLKSEFAFLAPKALQKEDIKLEYNIPQSLKADEEFHPSLSFYQVNGSEKTLLYNSYLDYSIQTLAPTPQPKELSPLVGTLLSVLKVILIVVGVCVLAIFLLRLYVQKVYLPKLSRQKRLRSLEARRRAKQ